VFEKRGQRDLLCDNMCQSDCDPFLCYVFYKNIVRLLNRRHGKFYENCRNALKKIYKRDVYVVNNY